jgi:S1-C subfamily serine protease
MEYLSKQQIILLALLVSFVSSIVTGISTVSLMSQDPQAITQTINRVVERTIETVTPSNIASVATPIKQVTTVVVKEEEFITKTVEEAQSTIVRIKNKKDGALLGIGVVVNTQGLIVAERIAVISYKEYQGVYKGKTYDLVLASQDKKSSIATLKFKEIPLDIHAAVFADTKTIKAGQSVVAVSGADRDIVSIGIISSLFENTDEAKSLNSIDTTIAQNSLLSGTPIFGLDGKLIALKIGKDDKDNDTLMSVSRISTALVAITPAQ